MPILSIPVWLFLSLTACRHQAHIEVASVVWSPPEEEAPPPPPSPLPQNTFESPRLGRLICLPGGHFLMGSPENEAGRDVDERQHDVTLNEFCVMETEVTQNMYEGLTGKNPSYQLYDGMSLIGASFPVQNISWYEAIAYANAVSIEDGLQPSYLMDGTHVSPIAGANGYRLLTESEWEYAARTGQNIRFSGTNDPWEVCNYANVADAAARAKWPDWSSFVCSDGYAGMAPVAQFTPNAWGLYDLTGNAWEWVWDGYGPYPEQATENPQGDDQSSTRVSRGGACYGAPQSTRVAYRDRNPPDTRFYLLGFRLARTR